MAMDTQIKDFKFYQLTASAIHESGRPKPHMAQSWTTVVMLNPYAHIKANIMGKNTLMERGISINYATNAITENDGTVTRLLPLTEAIRLAGENMRTADLQVPPQRLWYAVGQGHFKGFYTCDEHCR